MALVPVSSQALPACGLWAIVSSPNVDPISTDNYLNDVTAISPSNTWAVGSYSDALSPAPESSLSEHWNGTAWNVVPTPNATDSVNGISENRGNRLNAVTAISASNVWAVGAHATLPGDGIGSFTLVEHWNGTAWKIISSPDAGSAAELNAVVAKSASDVWAVGSSVASYPDRGERPLAMHWNGTSWQVISTPNYGTSSQLFGVAKIPGTSELWAVGEYEKVDPVTGVRTGGALIEKFNGQGWTVAAHMPGGESLNGWKSPNSVTAISASSAFAVGSSVMHWNGTSWNLMSHALPSNSGFPVELEAVTRAPNGNLWAAGLRIDAQTGSYHTLIERWDGTTWSVVPSADRGRSLLYGIARVPNSTRIWSVGYSSDSSPNRTLVETYC
jgi:hypothetical protein